MIQLQSPRWLGTAVLAACLAAGCRHTQQHDDWAGTVVESGPTTEMVTPPAPPATPMPNGDLNAPKPTESLNAPQPLPLMPPSSDNKKPPLDPAPANEAQEAPPEAEPVFHRIGSHPPTAETATPPTTNAAPAGTASAMPMPMPDSTAAPTLPSPAQQPTKAAAANVTSVVGELVQSPGAALWRLQCKAAGKDEPGYVTLVDTGSMKEFRPGQVVRVDGAFMTGNANEGDPLFRVHSILVIDNP